MTTNRTFSSRFTHPVFLWSVAAAITEVVVTWLLKHSQIPRWVGLLPVLPYLVFLAAFVRTALKVDEMQRRIYLESASIAFVLTLVISFVFGAVKQAEIGHPPWDVIGSVALLLWTGAYALTCWRYR
jgi:uncharacterized membrane protein